MVPVCSRFGVSPPTAGGQRAILVPLVRLRHIGAKTARLFLGKAPKKASDAIKMRAQTCRLCEFPVAEMVIARA